MNRPGVLLANLGSPDSPSKGDVRRYLREFLSDPRVMDSPWPVRMFVLHACILPRRPAASAHAYASIWTKEGAPLLVISRKIVAALRSKLSMPIELGMRYGTPSIPAAIARLRAEGVGTALFMPMFPQYAMSSYETAVEQAREAARREGDGMRLRVLPPFFAEPGYLAALVATLAPHLAEPYDHVLFSFHGVPERHLRKSDPSGRHCLATPDCCERAHVARATCYRAQALHTARDVAAAAGVPEEKWSVAWQSRLGRDAWIRPWTDEVLRELPSRGIKRLIVLCPAFTADCLETLEEIGLRGREMFLGAGGAAFTLVPCLNDDPGWVTTLASWARRLAEETDLE
ncbi:MAG: ferrochelatase [Verrucomicrobiae bacterium]|nr:ferrochelatase [Verrucomicrobiae bacterium]